MLGFNVGVLEWIILAVMAAGGLVALYLLIWSTSRK